MNRQPPADGKIHERGWNDTETGPDLVGSIRRLWWAPVLMLALAACGGSDGGGSDDDVHPAIRDMAATLEADGDCASLQAAFDRSDDADELRYIDAALERTGCYD